MTSSVLLIVPPVIVATATRSLLFTEPSEAVLPDVLRRHAGAPVCPSCITELNKYSMFGAIIFFTAGFASLSGGYAAYTAFRDTAVATALGVLWGLFIFTLDRLIVSGIRKQQHEPSDAWSVLFGKSLRGLLQAVPRIVLAVFLSIVIATPLELKLFEREIQFVYGTRHPDASHRSRGIGP